MLRKSLLVFFILCAAILIGCSKTEMSNSNTAADNSNKAATGSTSTTASGNKIGIPECDDFIAKYEACISGKVPEAARAQYQTMLKTWRDSWKQAASTPAGKAALAQGCKQAADQAAASMKTYGCAW